jgi:hypothetical protein
MLVMVCQGEAPLHLDGGSCIVNSTANKFMAAGAAVQAATV